MSTWYPFLGSYISQQVPGMWLMPKENFLYGLGKFYNHETLHLDVSESDLVQIGQIFLLRGHKNIPDFSVSSEYFIFMGDRSN
jgi:hypothetical protein